MSPQLVVILSLEGEAAQDDVVIPNPGEFCKSFPHLALLLLQSVNTLIVRSYTIDPNQLGLLNVSFKEKRSYLPAVTHGAYTNEAVARFLRRV